MPRALLAHQDSATIMASLDRRRSWTRLSRAICRRAGPLLSSAVSAPKAGKRWRGAGLRCTDDETAFRLLSALTVGWPAKFAAVALERARHGADCRPARCLTRAARSLVLTEISAWWPGGPLRDILADLLRRALSPPISA